MSGSRRQRAVRDRMASAARRYAGLGWPSFPGAHPPNGGDRACSCDRIGCPDPGAHPVSATWAHQASVDTEVIDGWWAKHPYANIILPTGRVFDVFDVPRAAGLQALASMDAAGIRTGPVAENGDRVLFFVATRGAPEDEDEWWSCQLDCNPETIDDTPGLRWHCRDSYVLAPPSVLPGGGTVTWLRPPAGEALPDPLRVLDRLADALD